MRRWRLVLAAAGCAVLLACGGFFPWGPGTGGGRVARNQLKELETSIQLFLLHHGRLPRALRELTLPIGRTGPILDAVPLDPWGRKFVYRPDPDASGGPEFRLSSRGPDQLDGTADDLSLPAAQAGHFRTLPDI